MSEHKVSGLRWIVTLAAGALCGVGIVAAERASDWNGLEIFAASVVVMLAVGFAGFADYAQTNKRMEIVLRSVRRWVEPSPLMHKDTLYDLGPPIAAGVMLVLVVLALSGVLALILADHWVHRVTAIVGVVVVAFVSLLAVLRK